MTKNLFFLWHPTDLLNFLVLFVLHTTKGNAISGPGAKQQKLSVPRLIDATKASTSTWHFSCAEHNKLTFEVGIRILPHFPVTSVGKWVLLHGLIIVRGIDHFCCFAPVSQNRISHAGIKETFSFYLKKFGFWPISKNLLRE